MKNKKSKKTNKNYSFISLVKKRFARIKEAIIGDLEEEERTSFSIMEVVGIIVISILFGMAIGYIIMYSRNPVHQVGRNKSLMEVVDTYQEIVQNYYGEIDEKKLSEEAIKGMIKSLNDSNSNYMDEYITNSFNVTVDGSFVGIGVTIVYENDYNRVVEVFSDSPAEKAGIQVDDILLKVDGKDVKGLMGDEISSLVRGKVGSKVKVVVQRGEEKKTFTITRGTIDIQSVSSDVISYENRKIGYIKITTFSDTTYKQFSKALKKIEKDDIDSLVLDVRDNPGGHLKQVTDVLSTFFPKKTALFQVQTKEKKEVVYSNSKESRKYPIMILINGGSASASEILASCFQDNYSKAMIIGNTSYGKGTIQKSVSLNTGTSFKYTTQKWLTSKGKWLNEKGVTPDIVINQCEEYSQNPVYENDTQLQEAFKQIKES